MSNYYLTKSGELYHWGVKGQKWGVRRYQNADGSLTDAGKKRYDSAKGKAQEDAYNQAYSKKANVLTTQGRKKDAAGNYTETKAEFHERVRREANSAGQAAKNTAKNPDVNDVLKKQVQRDLDATNTILRETSNVSRTTSNSIKNMRINVKKMDLSKMSDKEMRDRINRERLENEYNQMFNSKLHKVERGKSAVASVVEGIGTAATIVSSSLAIALAIRTLKKG